MAAASGERGAGKGAAALVPASAHSNPEREAVRAGIVEPTAAARRAIMAARWAMKAISILLNA
jgi:hypothetical protein